MSGIGSAGGPGGVGGPRGPGPGDGPASGDPAESGEASGADDPRLDQVEGHVGGAGGVGDAAHAGAVGDAGAAHAADAGAGVVDDQAIARLAADLEAGRITPDQAIDQLVEANLADLSPAEQTELREMLADALTNDPYLAGLVRDLAGTTGGGA